MVMYRCGSNSGGGVTPTPITPSDSTPAALTANTPVNPTANGYAIESQPQAVTPSTSGAAFNSGIVNMSSGGYAFSQTPKRVQTGDYTTNYTDPVTINLDFSPSLVIVYCNIDATQYAFVAISDNKGAFYGWNMHNSASAHNIGTFTWSGNSFTHKAYQSNMAGRPAHYVAIEEASIC